LLSHIWSLFVMDNLKKLKSLKGKTIAIVYIFEKEKAEGFDHFYIWKDEILLSWLKAIYEIKCVPYILDVRTFMQKASNHTLPHIDFVLNLNNGCFQLSTMSLVPSICSFLNIPCIPCNSLSILSCENKLISNCIINESKILVPNKLNDKENYGIYRPINLGNSMGIELGKFNHKNNNGIYQEFIPGYDITIPIMYNFVTDTMEILPATLYLPDSLDPNWIYDEKAKMDDIGFKTFLISKMEKDLINELKKILKVFEITTFARIDARIKCNKKKLSNKILDEPLKLSDLYFIEINSMPTIEPDDGFDIAYKGVLSIPNNIFFDCINIYEDFVENPTVNGFILASSIISYITSMC